MKEMFKKIPQNFEKPLTSSEKSQKLMTDIGGGWYLKKCELGLPPLKRTKLSKKAQDRHDIIFKNFMNLIDGGMIGNSNYIRTCLNGLIQNQTPKQLNPFNFLQKKLYINNNDITAHFVGRSKLTPLDIVEFYKWMVFGKMCKRNTIVEENKTK